MSAAPDAGTAVVAVAPQANRRCALRQSVRLNIESLEGKQLVHHHPPPFSTRHRMSKIGRRVVSEAPDADTAVAAAP